MQFRNSTTPITSLLAFCLLIFSSCKTSFNKRIYTKGFHVSRSEKTKAPTPNDKQLLQEKEEAFESSLNIKGNKSSKPSPSKRELIASTGENKKKTFRLEDKMPLAPQLALPKNFLHRERETENVHDGEEKLNDDEETQPTGIFFALGAAAAAFLFFLVVAVLGIPPGVITFLGILLFLAAGFLAFFAIENARKKPFKERSSNGKTLTVITCILSWPIMTVCFIVVLLLRLFSWLGAW